MAVPTTYLTSTKNLNGIIAAVKKAGVPSKLTYDFLKQLGYPSSSDRPVIPLFKALGLTDASGVPLDRYKRFRNASESKSVMAEALRDAYADVFAVDQEAHKASSDDLKGLFARVSGKSDSVAEKMALTFKALAAHADFGSAPPQPDPRLDDDQAEEREVEQLGLRLHHDIHIHLPVSTEIEVYDAIFRSLRQNLGS